MAPILHSPVLGFTGAGPAGVWFEDGRAETDDPAVLAYARRRGYGVGEEAPEPPSQPEPVDPRAVEVVHVGAPLRDAAVDPHPGDHLPPPNAGDANPHGPTVVAPQLTGEQGPRKPSARKRPPAKE
ncbi:hypothetical protein [Streptomyces microflavus]|uniref:hypothetical protein n=1 Tax=Streptomyces microflavus TaxID=1919 RepID=UPI002E3486D6|nr:hypothetical protein [Streptomyces microflavus]